MSLLEELQNRVRDAHHRPEVLTIREDQFGQLAEELNAMRMNPFADVRKVTADSLRVDGCWVFGIPVRGHQQLKQEG